MHTILHRSTQLIRDSGRYWKEKEENIDLVLPKDYQMDLQLFTSLSASSKSSNIHPLSALIALICVGGCLYISGQMCVNKWVVHIVGISTID